jgi:hypothetical protein
MTSLDNVIGMVMDHLTVQRESQRERQARQLIKNRARDENMIFKVCKRIIQLKHNIGIEVEPLAPTRDIIVIRTNLYEETFIFPKYLVAASSTTPTDFLAAN